MIGWIRNSARAFIFIIGLGALGCVEPFEPEIRDFQSALVVDGFISDADSHYEIKLSRTAPLDSPGSIPEQGAQVEVVSGEGGTYAFEESQPGVYRSDPTTFVGCTGTSYQLQIATQGDSRYQSSFVVLKPSPPIDSVYFEQELRLTDQGDTLDGIRIMVDTHDPTGQSNYYRYTWTETYEVRPRYPSYYEYVGYTLKRRDQAINLCFNSDTSKLVMLANTTSLREDRVSEFELTYVNTTTPFKLGALYSLLVRQQVLSEAGYRYWREVQKTTESLGTLFDPQPYQLIGNVRNVDDPDEAVLGFFDAGQVSEQRIFIDNDELSSLTWPRSPCLSQLKTFTARQEGDVVKDELNLFILWGYLVVDAEGLLWSVPECADCRVNGTLERPDFWPR